MAAVKQKKRGQVNRSRTKLILIAAEGRNKTEKLYFHELFQNNKDYRVRFTSSTETDPVGIVASAVQYIQSEELDLKNGDLAFCAVDTDTDMLKWGKMDRFDYTFDYTKRQCGAKPPFYAGFRLRKVIRVPCPPPYETEVSDHFRFCISSWIFIVYQSFVR